MHLLGATVAAAQVKRVCTSPALAVPRAQLRHHEGCKNWGHPVISSTSSMQGYVDGYVASNGFEGRSMSCMCSLENRGNSKLKKFLDV